MTCLQPPLIYGKLWRWDGLSSLTQGGSGLCIPASPSQSSVSSALGRGYKLGQASFLQLWSMLGEGCSCQPSVDSRVSSWVVGLSALSGDLDRAPQYPLCLVCVTRLTVLKRFELEGQR